MSSYVQKHLHGMTREGYHILLPYIADLIKSPYTCVQSVWALFNYVAQTLGPDHTASFFVPLLIQLLDGESTPKHLKLYHRTFIIQLVVRLGIKCFLTHFATILIEATAGYKNFHLNDDYCDEQQLSDAIDHDVANIQQFDQESLYIRSIYCDSSMPSEEQADMRNVSIEEEALKGEHISVGRIVSQKHKTTL